MFRMGCDKIVGGKYSSKGAIICRLHIRVKGRAKAGTMFK